MSSVAKVLAEHREADVSEADLASGLREVLRSRAFGLREPTSQLSREAESFLEAHSGIKPADLGTVHHQRAKTMALVALEFADALTTREVALLLERDESRVRHYAKDGQLYALRGAGRSLRFPRWQFGPQKTRLPHLAAVLTALPDDLHPVEVMRFFTGEADQLEIHGESTSPRMWLLGGGAAEPVVSLARSLAEGV
jgi:hypothetical protein